MRMLRNLSDTDKHRVLIPSTVTAMTFDVNLQIAGGAILATHEDHKAGHALRRGKALMSALVAVNDPLKYGVTVDVRIEVTPRLPRVLTPPPPGFGMIGLDVTLGMIRRECHRIVGELAPYVR